MSRTRRKREVSRHLRRILTDNYGWQWGPAAEAIGDQELLVHRVVDGRLSADVVAAWIHEEANR